MILLNWLKKYLIVAALKKAIDELIKKTGGIKMSASLVRFLRVALAVIVGVCAQYFGESEWWLTLTPILSAVCKYLRDKYGWEWLPF